MKNLITMTHVMKHSSRSAVEPLSVTAKTRQRDDNDTTTTRQRVLPSTAEQRDSFVLGTLSLRTLITSFVHRTSSLRTFKHIACLLLAFFVGVGNVWGAALSSLNFSEPTSLPTAYVYNTANSPAIATFAEKSCINVGNGGTPSFSADIFVSTGTGFDASKGKRWMGFTTDEDCDLIVTCGVGNASRTFSLYKSDGTKFCDDKTFSSTNTLVNWEIENLPAGKYVLIPSSSSAYVSAMSFSAATPATPACPTTVTISGTQTYTVGEKITLSVATDGNGTLTYQWYKDGTEEADKIDGSANASALTNKLEIERCALADAGDYYCRIGKEDCTGAINAAAYEVEVNPLGADLTAHTPGIYEKAQASGGYGAALITYDEREYETFYFTYTSSKLYLSAGNLAYNATGHFNLIDAASISAGTEVKGGDWFGSAANSYGNGSSPNTQQFNVSASRQAASLRDANKIRLKVSGYDQFAFIGKDASASGTSMLVVKIDGEAQTFTHSTTDNTIYSFDFANTGEHYIEITTAGGSSDNRVRAFSLRLPATEKHHVTYALNGGTGTAPTQEDVAEGATFTVASGAGLTPPEGQEFDKWNDGSADYAAGATYTMSTSDVTLTAVWKDHVESDDATLSDLTVAGETVTGFDAATTSYNIELPFGTSVVPTVAGTANSAFAKSVVVTPAASLPGNTTVVVTAENNSTKTYTIRFTVAASKVLDLVWKTGQNACEGAGSQATVIKSNDAKVSPYIKAITFENVEGTGDNAAEGSSLNTGKKAGNVIIIQTQPGYLFTAMSFFGKIESADTKCQISVDGGVNWSDLASTSGSDATYCNVVSGASTSDIRIKGCGTAGTWIRNMQLTITTGCGPVTLAWAAATATEVEVGKAASVSAVANNGTVSYASDATDVIEVASDGALTVKALGSATITASVSGGDGTLYCAEAPSDINVTLNTYYLVEFDVQGGDAVLEDVKYFSGDAALTAPSAGSQSGFDFEGWYDAATDGNAIEWPLTPAASQKIYAHWTAQCAGPTITTQPVGANYLTGRTAAALTCQATVGAAGELTYTWYSCDDTEKTNPVALAGAPTPSTAAAGTFYYYCVVAEAGCAVEKTSNVVTVTVADKDGILLVKAELEAGSTNASISSKTGAFKDDENIAINVAKDLKLGGTGCYVKVAVDGAEFQDGDVVEIVLKADQNASAWLQVFADEGTTLVAEMKSGVSKEQPNRLAIADVPANTKTLYLYRTSTAAGNMNPYPTSMAVYRVSAPILNKITVNGIEGTPNASNEIAIEVPATTTQSQLEAITYDWVSNNDAWTEAHAPIATNAWEFSVQNTVTFTDKDGDASVYYVTVTKAAAIDRVEISGTLSVMEDATTTLSAVVYDTNDAEASIQDVTWSVKAGDEDYASVSADGVVTGKAVGTAHIIATSVADPSISAQVEVAVSAFSGCRKAYWFGYAADAETNGVENNSTVFVGAPSSASSNSNKTIKLIADEWEVSVSKKTGSMGSFGTFNVPAGYSATLYVVTNTGGSRTFQLKQGDDVKYTQSASSGDPVVTVFENVASGSYTVLSTSNCSGFYMMAAELCRVPMTGVALDITSKSMLTIDAPFQLTPTFAPANASDKRVSWSSDNESVATVVDGLVTPVAAGTARITVTTTDGGFADVCAVTVSAIECATFDGVLYQMTAKEQASKKDISVSAGETNEVALTTADVVYTRGAAASFGYKGTSGSKTPRITAKSGETLSSVDYNSGDVYVKIPLACNLRPKDVITFTANDDTKELALGNTASAVGTINTTSLSYTVQVGDALNGNNVLYVWRGANAGFVSITVTRPELVPITSVSLADMTIRTTKSRAPELTTNPADGTILSVAYEITGSTPASTINPNTGVVTAGDVEETFTVQVTVNGDKVATCEVAVVTNMTQLDVEESTSWDFSKAGTTERFSEEVLANVDGVTLDASQFNARQLYGSANNIAATYFQGSMLSFNATKAGKLTIKFKNGNENTRTLAVYDNADNKLAEWNYTNTNQTQSVYVPAGKVTLKATENGASTNVRILTMTYEALIDQRGAGWAAAGELGTVCLKSDAFVTGANLYELQGLDENGKLAFDQILSGVLEAGKPYLFEATSNALINFYAPVDANTTETAESTKGMYGTFVNKTFTSADADIYYFSGTHIYGVKNFTVAITIPAYLCYMDMSVLRNAPAADPTPAPGRRRVTMGVQGAQVTTGVEDVQSDNVQSTKVLIDGRLYILRGEKMYDATGKLLK